MTVAQSAEQLLRNALGEQAKFRDGQLEAIVGLVEQRSRVLVVQRTGWGKSVVYFIATRLLRDRGSGPTILISPLLSLMRDQVRMADALGVVAKAMDSTNPERWSEIEDELASDSIDLLLVSPERLANIRFRTKTMGSIRGEIGLLVVDEAHCISDWGHDFRPDYRRIRMITEDLQRDIPLLATTATANDRVVADIDAQLGPELLVVRGPLARKSLHLQVISLASQAERLAWLLEYLKGVEGSGIVYALTVADVRRVSGWLTEHGIDASPYYGAMGTEERERLEDDLRENRVKALVATVALGMGFDKPDLAFVLHFQRPPSAIAYYQQIGRAGRQIDRAEVVLLAGAEDDAIAGYFISEALPPPEVMREILAVIEEGDGARLTEIEARVNAKRGAIERALKILEVEVAVEREGPVWTRTANAWQPDVERAEAVTKARLGEMQRMREYVESDACLMQFLAQELDDPVAERCGRCANCTEPFLSSDPDAALAGKAATFLKSAYRPIKLRKQWPRGLAERKGRIPEQYWLREGRTLAVERDAGWGELIRNGVAGDGGFSDELVEAVKEMIEDDLRPSPPPTWVTAVPTGEDPDRVSDFARLLADHLQLPFRPALRKTRDTPPQADMANSVQQARNVIGAYTVDSGEVIREPVLLVTDLVSSRWTITVCGVELAEARSGPVFPIALRDSATSTGP